MRIVIALFAFAAVSASGCSSKVTLCTRERIDVLSNTCKLGLLNDVGAECFKLPDAQAVYEQGGYGVQACKESESGELLRCIVDKPDECSSARDNRDRQQALTDACAKQYPTAFQDHREEECVATCFNTYDACNKGCPETSAKACFDCSAQCGSSHLDCTEKCPMAK